LKKIPFGFGLQGLGTCCLDGAAVAAAMIFSAAAAILIILAQRKAENFALLRLS
jgi:hypothetical protein